MTYEECLKNERISSIDDMVNRELDKNSKYILSENEIYRQALEIKAYFEDYYEESSDDWVVPFWDLVHHMGKEEACKYVGLYSNELIDIFIDEGGYSSSLPSTRNLMFVLKGGTLKIVGDEPKEVEKDLLDDCRIFETFKDFNDYYRKSDCEYNWAYPESVGLYYRGTGLKHNGYVIIEIYQGGYQDFCAIPENEYTEENKEKHKTVRYRR